MQKTHANNIYFRKDLITRNILYRQTMIYFKITFITIKVTTEEIDNLVSASCLLIFGIIHDMKITLGKMTS